MEAFETIAVDRAVMHEAKALASESGLSVEEVPKQALEHGIVGLREAQWFHLRRGKGNMTAALELLRRAGNGRPPDPGDEIPENVLVLYPEIQGR